MTNYGDRHRLAPHWRKFIGNEQKMSEYFLRISSKENWKLRRTSLDAFHVLLVQNSLKTPKTALKLESDTESFKTTFVNLKCVNFQITVNIFCWPKYIFLSRVGGFLRQACQYLSRITAAGLNGATRTLACKLHWTISLQRDSGASAPRMCGKFIICRIVTNLSLIQNKKVKNICLWEKILRENRHQWLYK